ncbi:MAG: hypothetical protein M3R47_07270 [Chloroflexota bacterium]|nr:hypothetical protein [Chloroflexota bacterium]
MVESFKVVNLTVELANAVTTEIIKLAASKPVGASRYATPTYITFLLIEVISDNVIEALTIAKKTGSLSASEMYFNNSAAYLKDLERVLRGFSKWLSTYQKSSLPTYPVNIREFLYYLAATNLHPAKESENLDFDIKLLRYGNSHPSAQYVDKMIYHFEQLKIGLQANCSMLEKYHNTLAPIKTIKNISIRARMAVAIECILKEAKRLSPRHAELDKFIEFFWSLVEQDDLAGWDTRLRAYDELCEIWNEDNRQLSKEVASIPEHIREMCRYAVELGGCELYGAVQSYSPYTYQHLLGILRILAYPNGEIVEFGAFQKSSFGEMYGWGFPRHRSWFTASG